MPEFAIGLGSNLGDRIGNLMEGIRFLLSRSGMGTFRLASVYETPPIEDVEGGNFLNSVLIGTFYASPNELQSDCREAEILLGSMTRKNNRARTLDMDLLFFKDTVIDEGDLILPHPRLHLRKFVLSPLAEVWHEKVPGLGLTPDELLAECPDNSKITRVYEMPDSGCFWEVTN